MVNQKMIVGADLTKTYTAASGASTATDISNLPYSPGEIIVKATPTGGTKRYKFVLFEDQAAVAGYLACYTTDDNGYEVSTKNGEGANDVLQPAGICMSATADGSFGWIQTYGLNDVAMLTDGGIAAGDALVPHATTDGGVDTYAATETQDVMCGQALNADTGTVMAIGEVFLNCPKG